MIGQEHGPVPGADQEAEAADCAAAAGGGVQPPRPALSQAQDSPHSAARSVRREKYFLWCKKYYVLVSPDCHALEERFRTLIESSAADSEKLRNLSVSR